MTIDIDVCVTFNTEELIWKYFEYVHHTNDLISTFGTLELNGKEALNFLDWVKKESNSKSIHTRTEDPKPTTKKPKLEKSSGKKWNSKEKELLKSKVYNNRPPEKISYFLPTRSLPAITRRIYGKLKRKWDPKTKTYVSI